MTKGIHEPLRLNLNDSFNHGLRCERYGATLLVFTPAVKWSHLSLPYTGELERILKPAINYEEQAILVAPNKFTALMLKLEGFPANIPVILGEKEARQKADELEREARLVQ
jgi:hypothetical protein